MSEAPKATVTIKKYANRRLYNTATSTYVTLENLSAMVKEGTEFNVYDAKTGEDITRSVLTQIIVEEEGKSGQQNLLPIGFLRQLIGFYGDNMQWMVPKYLEHSMQALSKNQEQMRSYFQNTFGSVFPFGTTLEEMGKQNLAMFERAMRMFSPFNAAGTMANMMPGMPNMNMGASSEPKTASTNAPAAKEEDSDSDPEPAQTPAATAFTFAQPQPQTVAQPQSPTERAEAPRPVVVAPAPAPQAASVTSIVRRAEAAPAAVPTSSYATAGTASPAYVTSATPMPNVATATAATATADDMQTKIANLQRQLADLAKGRAS